MTSSPHPTDPPLDCPLCPRLVKFIDGHKENHPDWHNAPVPTWIPESANGGRDAVRLLVVGMAPGLKGANRTGRPFTGDFAGDLLYETLVTFSHAEGRYEADPDDSLKLRNCAITNAVRCVPPQNKPVGEEVNNCRPFLTATLNSFPNLTTLVTLGKIAHDTTARTLGERVAAVPFSHNAVHQMGKFQVVSSYHCSRYNTNTGRLTQEMFHDVFRTVQGLLG